MPLRLNHSPASDGAPTPISFALLMELEKINEFTFRSCTRAFEPGGPLRSKNKAEKARAYGGHVYAQAVWAAAQTVPEQKGKDVREGRFCVHSVTGFFTLPAAADLPFVYSVKTIRDGRSFCVRAVHVSQEETRGICFTCTVSFKRPEVSRIEFQDYVDIERQYASVLKGKQPQDHPNAPSTETPWFRKDPVNAGKVFPFPGLNTQRVNMLEYNKDKAAKERRQLYLYSALGNMPTMEDESNLHACAHLYASDRNSLFIVARHLGLMDVFEQMASLSHTVIFHTNGERLAADGGKWFTQEVWTDRAGDGRGVHHSRIFDESGRHLATTMQDGLLRVRFRNETEERRIRSDLEDLGGSSKL